MTAQISVQMIKSLRERTGVGMGKCKEALLESQGDIELAIANLRKAGMATAVKKEGREAKEGRIGVIDHSDRICIAEVNAETDFVANNENFHKFLNSILEEVAVSNPSSLEEFLQGKYSKDAEMTVDQYRTTFVQMLGENIQVRRLKTFPKSADLSIGVYSHLDGKIVVVVLLEGSNGEESLAKQIAMHAAATSPEYLSSSDVPESIIAQEKEIVRSQVQGKPEHIMEKILQGKLDSYFNSVCLERQPFVRDDSLSIAELVDKRAKETGKSLKLASFVRWCLGE